MYTRPVAVLGEGGLRGFPQNAEVSPPPPIAPLPPNERCSIHKKAKCL